MMTLLAQEEELVLGPALAQSEYHKTKNTLQLLGSVEGWPVAPILLYSHLLDIGQE